MSSKIGCGQKEPTADVANVFRLKCVWDWDRILLPKSLFQAKKCQRLGSNPASEVFVLGWNMSGTGIESSFWCAFFRLECSILPASNALQLLPISNIYNEHTDVVFDNILKTFLRFKSSSLPYCNSSWNSCLGNLTSSIQVRCKSQRIWLCMRSISILEVFAP